jgi:hypothetical protein
VEYLSPGRQTGVLPAVWELPSYAALFPFFEDYSLKNNNKCSTHYNFPSGACTYIKAKQQTYLVLFL